MSKRRKNQVEKISGYEYIYRILDLVCAWCSRRLGFNGTVYTVIIRQPNVDWSGSVGEFVPLPILVPEKPTVPAFVLKRNPEAFQEEFSLYLAFCSPECSKEFKEAFEVLAKIEKEIYGSMASAFSIEERKAKSEEDTYLCEMFIQMESELRK